MMDNEVNDLLSELREAAVPDEVAAKISSKFEELSRKVDYLSSLQSETMRAYQALVLMGNFIQKVSVDGQPLPQDFGIHFANSIQQLITTQFTALFNARDNQPK